MQLTPDDLYPLEQYAKLRNEFRAKVMEHKKHRRIGIGIAHPTYDYQAPSIANGVHAALARDLD